MTTRNKVIKELVRWEREHLYLGIPDWEKFCNEADKIIALTQEAETEPK